MHPNALVIAESGFVNHAQILRYAGLVDGFLVGTSLMRARRIDLALRELIFWPGKNLWLYLCSRCSLSL